MYFETIGPFNSATDVNLKMMEHNINYETTTIADIRREHYKVCVKHANYLP